MNKMPFEIIEHEDKIEIRFEKDLIVTSPNDVYMFAKRLILQSEDIVSLNAIPNYVFKGDIEAYKTAMREAFEEALRTATEKIASNVLVEECEDCHLEEITDQGLQEQQDVLDKARV